jgi:hypothetical protein
MNWELSFSGFDGVIRGLTNFNLARTLDNIPSFSIKVSSYFFIAAFTFSKFSSHSSII